MAGRKGKARKMTIKGEETIKEEKQVLRRKLKIIMSKSKGRKGKESKEGDNKRRGNH